jgi:serine/threonine protein kinase
MTEINEILTENEIEKLKQQGYTPIRYIGSGHTRDVFEAVYEKNGLTRVRALKIPKKDLDKNSICTMINLSRMPKGNPNVNELVCSNEIKEHPNIATIIDAPEIDGRIATVEEYVDGETLEELVKKTGPLRREQFKEVFTQVLEGIKYLHKPGIFANPIIHRDIKPSNILIGKLGKVKISDLQNAKQERYIEDRILPTRGGTPYTSPTLLNILSDDQASRASDETDIYALGATMYFALTGKLPFNYKLEHDEEGKILKIGENQFRVSLFDGDRKIDQITKGEHESNLNLALKKAPRAYRKMLRKCLRLDRKGFYDICDLRWDLESTDKRQTFMDTLRENRNLIFWTSLGIFTLATMWHLGAKSTEMIDKDRSPTIFQLLDEKKYLSELDVGMGADLYSTPTAVLEDMKHYAKELKVRSENKELKNLIRDAQQMASTRGGYERELEALVLSCYTTRDFEKMNAYHGEDRSKKFLVPLAFYRAAERDYQTGYENLALDGFREVFWAYSYLKMCGQPGDRMEDVFAKYFCTNEEVFAARKKAGQYRYFTTFDSTGLKFGWREYISPVRRELIDRALTYYLLTDEKGELKDSLDFSPPVQSPQKSQQKPH